MHYRIGEWTYERWNLRNLHSGSMSCMELKLWRADWSFCLLFCHLCLFLLFFYFFFFNSYEQHGSSVWMTSAHHPSPDWNILYFQWIARKFFLFMLPIQFIPWLFRWLRLRLTFQVLDVFLWDFVIHALLRMKGSKTVCCLKLFRCALGSHEGIEH